jgi:hypothetical protein
VPSQNSMPSLLPFFLKDTDYAFAVYQEILRINGHHKIDFTEAPLIDSEGIIYFISACCQIRVSFYLTADLLLKRCKYENEAFLLRCASLFYLGSSHVIQRIEKQYGISIPESRIIIKGTAHEEDDNPPDIRIVFYTRESAKPVEAFFESIQQYHHNLCYAIIDSEAINKETEGLTYTYQLLY